MYAEKKKRKTKDKKKVSKDVQKQQQTPKTLNVHSLLQKSNQSRINQQHYCTGKDETMIPVLQLPPLWKKRMKSKNQHDTDENLHKRGQHVERIGVHIPQSKRSRKVRCIKENQ